MATVVFDADDTLWEGLILHGQPVTLKPGAAETIKELSKRGHRLVCASRNDLDNLNRVLGSQDILRYFTVVAAGWGPKSEMFAQFYAPGEPTLFIDDDPFNHAEVRRLYPDVEMLLPPSDFLTLLEHPAVSRDLTPEDRRRVDLLREQQARIAAQDAYSGSYQDFLRESQIRLTIYESLEVIPDRQRALDLLNRTTEQRTMQQRYDRLPGGWVFGASLVDRYGDYGLIGVGVVKDARNAGLEPVTLDDLAVSCRTMGRGIGSALVAWLCHAIQQANYQGVYGRIRKTDRNTSMQQIFEYLGFQVIEQSEDETRWFWRSSDSVPSMPDWIAVTVVE